MKFDNIIIVTDLDGTFLDEHEGRVERNLRAIEYFKQNGGRFTIATGRAAEHALGAVPCAPWLVNLPAVTCNGACLYDFRTGESPVLHTISFDEVKEIVAFVRSEFSSVGVRASSPEYCFVSTPEDMENPFLKSDLSRYADTKNLIAPMEKWKDTPIFKVVLRVDSELLPKLMSALRDRFGDRFSFTQSWATIIDIQPSGVNKGVTLEKYVRETLGEEVKIYACGDYVNDLEMLECADVAVCPSNAHEQVKAVCDLCFGTNSDGLIADLVEYLDKRQ